MEKQAYELEKARIKLAKQVTFLGLLLSAVLAAILFFGGMKASSDIVAVVGIFTSVTGTLVGTFLGFHAGSSGREQERAKQNKMEVMTRMAFAIMSPAQVLQAIEMAKVELNNDP